LSLVALVRERAEAAPEALAYRYLVDGEREQQTLTAGGLELEARRVASVLAEHVEPGGRALLVFESGLDFVVAFFGCLFAGVVAVPVAAPAPPRVDASLAHIERVVRDCGAGAVLTSGAVERLTGAQPGLRERLGDVLWIVSTGGDAAAWRDPGVGPAHIAFLQYTSGSTADPRGVVLRHEHLLANQRALDWFGRHPSEGAMVSWLPLYHDMGLIGGVLYPLYSGLPGHLFSPAQFLQRPSRWLKLLSGMRGAMSGGPNFAYELCLQRVSAETRAALDLSGWEVAFNGSEVIRADTVRAFEAAFAPCGLRPGTVVGCYGLAEATLLVSGAHREEPGRVLVLGERELVSSGGLPPDHDVRVVDPETGVELPPGEPGEIWFRGPAAAQGYWRRPEETARTFGASLDGRTYLRTGDIGILTGGQLYVTGRLKELLVVRGRNVHPYDIEDAAQRADPRLRRGRGVAFSLETAEGEGVGLIQETTATAPEELGHLAAAVSRAVLEAHGIALTAIYLTRRQSVLRTSSGKLRRLATVTAMRNGELAVLHREEWGAGVKGARRAPGTEYVAPRNEVEQRIAAIWQRLLGIDAVGVFDIFFELGGDSVFANRLLAELDSALGVSLDPSRAFESFTVAHLAELAEEQVVAQLGAMSDEEAARLLQHVWEAGGR
jgi:acyl-CoA synthetase (AMP-forming)/AMP-acid ligase II/acyl carrier protein